MPGRNDPRGEAPTGHFRARGGAFRRAASPCFGVLSVGVLLLLVACGCQSDRPRPVTVFVASSALPVVEELAAKEPASIAVHGASSSTLARQIAAGARADLFISAHPLWLEELAEKERIDLEARRLFARNSLVIVARSDGPTDLAAATGRIAIGDPAHVPLGVYAKEALVASSRFEGWRDRLLPAADARSTLEYLLSGEAELAIVYLTDVFGRENVRVLEEVDRALHAPIELWIVPLLDRGEVSAALIERWTSPAVREELRARGFGVPERKEGDR